MMMGCTQSRKHTCGRWALFATVCVGLLWPCWGFVQTLPFQNQQNRCSGVVVVVVVVVVISNDPQEWIGSVTHLSLSSTAAAEAQEESSEATTIATTTTTTTTDGDRKPCFYKSPKNNRWRPRLELSELTIGQELADAVVVQELLDGKTGPKLFCEVGAGRCSADGRQRWKIVNAMLRMGPRGTKKSVVAKRTARLRSKTQGFPVYVSRIRLENDQLEVCLDRDEVVGPLSKLKDQVKRVSVSLLQPGHNVTGTVVRVKPYGVLVDVGANRHGLLHITKVAKLLRKRIDSETGLKEAGLAKGSRIQLQVASNQRKRLFLDFTQEVKEMAAQELETNIKSGSQKTTLPPSSSSTTTTNGPKATVASTAQEHSSSASGSKNALSTEDEDDYEDDDYEDSSSSNKGLSSEEEAAWAAYAEQLYGSGNNAAQSMKEEEEEEYDDYDEDSDIEDAFGLGTY